MAGKAVHTEVFRPLLFPLQGKRLIEASAGTGKTYNIANLFLRLVLGHGSTYPFTVDQILVVTFTRAATSELNGRIRARLEEALLVFRGGETEDFFIQKLAVELADDSALSIKRLNDALLSMDEASISTIHSFAVQAARTFLFETGALADIQISESGSDAKTQIITDLYRDMSMQYGQQSPDFYALVPGKSFNDFHRYYGNNIPLDCKILPDTPGVTGVSDLHVQYCTKRDELQNAHNDFVQEWEALFPGKPRELDKDYCNKITDRFNNQLLDEFKNEFKLRRTVSSLVGYLCTQLSGNSADYLEKSTTNYFKAWMRMPERSGDGNCFDMVMRLRDHFRTALQFKSETKMKGAGVILRTLQQKQAEFALDQMALDDVIHLINQKLADEKSAKSLRRIITQTYPVCLVDEFQDTDPEQFRMFNEIYSDAGDNTGFFMIGDPKQSIYAFRGADIFSYLNVRAEIAASQAESDQKIFSLDTNWRSKAALIEVTNKLFRESAQIDSKLETAEDNEQEKHKTLPVFLFKGIEYQTVKSCEDEPHLAKKPGFQINDETAPALVFIGNPDTESKKNKGTLHRKYAKDTAARISALLHAATGGKIKTNENDAQPLSPQDIAVLVRSGREARVIRDELARKEIGIRCVYLSQKDSVFSDSEISEDLYHVLVAINEHSDKRRLKAALATPLLRGFKFNFDEVDGIEESDNVLESLIEEFGGYKKLWREYGLLAALNRLMGNQKRGLFSSIASRPDSDRIFTDLRHLGDLLQQQDLESDSSEQLIDWYASQLNDDSSLDEDSKRIRLESDENLVKIVTIHVSKGLEYPVVFLPFFYLPWPVNLKIALPLYHANQKGAGQNSLKAIVNFSSDDQTVKAQMQRESLAEDMRLLYVAITRAVYQCYIGISTATHGGDTKHVFKDTVWAHLLEVEVENPDWPAIQFALENHFGVDPSVDYRALGDVEAKAFQPPLEQQVKIIQPDITVRAPTSSWRITSYSALAHGKKLRSDTKADDEVLIVDSPAPPDEILLTTADREWATNPRYTLKGSATTGDCLHQIFEDYALAPNEDFEFIVEQGLSGYGLEKPRRKRDEKEQPYQARCEIHLRGIKRWLTQALTQPLEHVGAHGFPSLYDLIQSGQLIPEMDFDFAIGSDSDVVRMSSVNQALKNAGLDGVAGYEKIHGLMTGTIDLVFVHDARVYVLDYKSNTLGKAPRFYDQGPMGESMAANRFNLQYMIYSTAVHRYFSRYFMEQYAFDEEADKSLSFGGVFYLFLRGMGLPPEDYAQHGVWFTRPEDHDIKALDQAFSGKPSGESQ